MVHGRTPFMGTDLFRLSFPLRGSLIHEGVIGFAVVEATTPPERVSRFHPVMG